MHIFKRYTNFESAAIQNGIILISDVTKRNPVTGNGVDSWDCRPASRNSPKIRTGKYSSY